MREYKNMNDAKRLSLLEEYLSSALSKSSFEKEKGLSKSSISSWLRTFAIEDKPIVVKVALPMSEETDKTALLNPEDEIVRLKQELKAKEIELRRVTMARDAYDRMTEIAEEKYAIPIRKNSDAK